MSRFYASNFDQDYRSTFNKFDYYVSSFAIQENLFLKDKSSGIFLNRKTRDVVIEFVESVGLYFS